MASVRGAVLGGSFTIEHELLSLALAAQFGTNDADSAPPAYLAQLDAWRAEYSFHAHIERAKPIIRGHWERKQADRLIQDLASARDLRNAMAHCPCWLECVNDEVQHLTVSYRLLVADRRHVWEVTSKQIQAWSAMLSRALRGVEQLRREILGVAPRPMLDEAQRG
jgi:hypothetical protein